MPAAVCFALAAKARQCLLKLSRRSNRIPSQRVASPGGGAVTVQELWVV